MVLHILVNYDQVITKINLLFRKIIEYFLMKFYIYLHFPAGAVTAVASFEKYPKGNSFRLNIFSG